MRCALWRHTNSEKAGVGGRMGESAGFGSWLTVLGAKN